MLTKLFLLDNFFVVLAFVTNGKFASSKMSLQMTYKLPQAVGEGSLKGVT